MQNVSVAAPQGADPPRRIVAFDFDGTLTIRDSFTAFLRLKAASVEVFLRGVARAELEAQARTFCTAWADALLRPDALAAWARHGAQGDHRVIVTASPEILVRPFAERLGADALIGTRLAFDPREQVAGRFEGLNCRGEEKVARLRDRFGEDVRIADAYGDTDGDREMLAVADRGHMRVFTGRPPARGRVSRA